MKLIGLGVTLAGVVWSGLALAQDAPPPGCRWQTYAGDQILACKDGKGNWRRSGDDLVVGTYPMPKPKPKPAAPVAKAAAPSAAAAAAPAATAVPVTKSAEDAALPAIEEGAAAQGADAAAPSAADAAVDASAAAAEEATAPAPEPVKKPWWQAIWDAILNFFRSIGLLK